MRPDRVAGRQSRPPEGSPGGRAARHGGAPGGPGAQGENCARFLSKGRPVAVDGRLEWREWETQDGNKRQSVEIVADAVQFLGGRDDAQGGGGGFTPRSDVPVNESDFQTAGAPAGNGTASASDDDIPF